MKKITSSFSRIFVLILMIAMASSCSQVRYSYYNKVKGEKAETAYRTADSSPETAASSESGAKDEQKREAGSFQTAKNNQVKAVHKRDASAGKSVSGVSKSSFNNGQQKIKRTQTINALLESSQLNKKSSNDTSLLWTILLIILLLWLIGFLLIGSLVINLLWVVILILLVLILIRYFG